MFSPFCHGEDYGSIDALAWTFDDLGMGQNHVPLVNLKIAGKPGKWMFIPLKMVLIGIDPYSPCFSSFFKIQNSCFLDEQVTCSSRKPEFDCQQGHQMSDWSFPKVSVVFQEIDKQASGGLDCWILLVLDAGCHGLSPKRPVDHCLMLQPIFVNTFTLGFSTKKS